MLLVAPAVAGLKFPCLETFQVTAQRIADQRRTVHPRPLGGSIRGAEQCRIQYNLDSFHTVESTLHWTQQSIVRCRRLTRHPRANAPGAPLQHRGFVEQPAFREAREGERAGVDQVGMAVQDQIRDDLACGG